MKQTDVLTLGCSSRKSLVPSRLHKLQQSNFRLFHVSGVTAARYFTQPSTAPDHTDIQPGTHGEQPAPETTAAFQRHDRRPHTDPFGRDDAAISFLLLFSYGAVLQNLLCRLPTTLDHDNHVRREDLCTMTVWEAVSRKAARRASLGMVHRPAVT